MGSDGIKGIYERYHHLLKITGGTNLAQKIIEIDTAMLQGDEQNIAEQAADLQRDLTEISSLIEQLGSMWDGPARQAFQAQMAEDLGILSEICSFMQKYTGWMQQAGGEYVKCENAVQEIIAAVRI